MEKAAVAMEGAVRVAAAMVAAMLSDFAHCVDLYVSGSRSSHGSHSTDIGPHQAHEACAMRREVVEAKRQFSNTTLSFRYDLFTRLERQTTLASCIRICHRQSKRLATQSARGTRRLSNSTSWVPTATISSA